MSDTTNQEVFDFLIKEANGYGWKGERITRKVMIELIKAGRSEFLILRDDEVSEWWNKIYSTAQVRFDKYNEKLSMYNTKMEAYNKLTADERKILGIRKPLKPKEL